MSTTPSPLTSQGGVGLKYSTRLLPASDTYSPPAASGPTPHGLDRLVALSPPWLLSFEAKEPAWPQTRSAVVLPAGECSTRLLPLSAMNSPPYASVVTPR